MIQFYNRKTQTLETEKVLGGQFVDLAYKSKIGSTLTHHALSRSWFSKILGTVEDSRWSTRKISAFIQNYGIDMSEFEEKSWKSFNEFFIRQFKPGARPFSCNPLHFCAGAEARYFAYENTSGESRFKIKHAEIQLSELLGDEALAQAFEGGTVIIARLCPVDYHRFHYPIDATVEARYTVHGKLHSVNPVALESRPDVFLINEREVTLFTNPLFGKVAQIEVGAIGVGKIVQTHADIQQKFDCGQEKGYFLFGGSTVIWLIQKGKISLSQDLLEYSQKGIETWIPLGGLLGEYRNGSDVELNTD